ncbi:MAG: hypothetical protein AAF639_01365 [Chloroflexota bacterium]
MTYTWQFLLKTGVFIPVAFIAFMLWRDPFSFPADYDYDEGINLMKTMLYDQGFRLYIDVWNDQPPLLTVMLSQWFDWVGQSVESARFLITLFSALLLWSFYLAMHQSVTAFAATIGVVLLVLSEFYLRLSAAVMVGLPSIALAMLSITLLMISCRQEGHEYKTPKKIRISQIILSAIVMALALQTKLFVLILLPFVGFYFLLSKLNQTPPLTRQRTRFVQAIIWGTVLLSAFFIIGLYFRSLNPSMLIQTHFGAETRGQIAFAEESREFLVNFATQQRFYLFLAAVGVFWGLLQRRRGVLLPLFWFVISVVGMAFHRPLWYHHIVLLTIPLSWMAAFSVEAWAYLFNNLANAATTYTASMRMAYARLALLVASTLVFFVALLFYPSALPKRIEEQSKTYRPLYVWEMVHQLRDDGLAEPGFVFTDRPFYAFQAGQPVTPPIASISRKRIETGIITDETMYDALIDYEPQYIILERFVGYYGDAVMAEINAHFELILEIGPARYYRRIDS